MTKIIIIGYSGHAYVVADAILSAGGTILGYCDKQEKNVDPFGMKYLGQESEELLIGKQWIIGIGDNHIRERISDMYKLYGQFRSVFHESAIIGSGSELGAGVFLAARTVINPLSKIGKGSIINTGAIIEHECEIGNYAHIAPGATLAGNVKIGNRTFIGANAVVKQGIKIGSDVIVGAGSVILQDVEDNVTIVGNPGRIIK